jgi:hypothetical protein
MSPMMNALKSPLRIGLALLAASCVSALSPIASAGPELISPWTGFDHPLSYQGRVLTRDSKGNYFAVFRAGNDVNVWRRDVQSGTWSNLGAVNGKPLSGREGECGSIAVDGKDQVHVVYYDGSAPDLAHRMSTDGKSFGPADPVQSAVTWNATAAGGPFLHVGMDNSLHAAFIGESGEKPYYAGSVDGGKTWIIHKVADAGNSNLRPSVITLPKGRIVFGYSAPNFRCSISDDGGKTWTDASPASAGIGSMVNCRLAGNGDDVHVTGQKTDPDPRAILANKCKGTDMKWGAWETVFSGSGADASLFIDADGNRRVLWRQYPDQPNALYLSSDKGGWQRQKVEAPAVDFILPYAYWQEYHRGNPASNLVSLLAPDLTNHKLYFLQLQVGYLPDGSTTPVLPGKAKRSGGLGRSGAPLYDVQGQRVESRLLLAGNPGQSAPPKRIYFESGTDLIR